MGKCHLPSQRLKLMAQTCTQCVHYQHPWPGGMSSELFMKIGKETIYRFPRLIAVIGIYMAQLDLKQWPVGQSLSKPAACSPNRIVLFWDYVGHECKSRQEDIGFLSSYRRGSRTWFLLLLFLYYFGTVLIFFFFSPDLIELCEPESSKAG